MTQTRVARSFYLWVPPAIAIALLAYSTTTSVIHWNLTTLLAVVMWSLLVAIADASPIALPWPDARLRLSPVFEFGALLVFGTVPAAIITAIGRFHSSLIQRNRPWDAAHTALRSMLVVVVAGIVYADQGGSLGSQLASAPTRFTPVVMAMAVYALADALLRVWRVLAEQPGVDPRVLMSGVQKRIVSIVLVLPLGLGFGWLEALAGPVAAACALMPMLVARRFERVSAPEPASADSGAGSRLATVRVLMSAIDAFDPFTRGHSFRVSRYSMSVARQLGVSGHELDEIEYGALLHDIGRTAIHLDVLMRPRPLDARERSVLQTHPTVGYEIVKTLPDMQAAAEIVYAHHEQPDGLGYPRGLRGSQVPLGARVVSVAAAYDAMTQQRPYRRGLPPATACEELKRHAGTQFFPEVVEAFVALQQSGELDRGMGEPNGMVFLASPNEAPADGAAA